jgi:hypothetical protein
MAVPIVDLGGVYAGGNPIFIELTRRVTPCVDHIYYCGCAYPRIYIKKQRIGLTWYRVKSASPLSPQLTKIEAKVATMELTKRSMAKKRITRSLYTLFALRALLPEDVAWIIVVLAHWSNW